MILIKKKKEKKYKCKICQDKGLFNVYEDITICCKRVGLDNTCCGEPSFEFSASTQKCECNVNK